MRPTSVRGVQPLLLIVPAILLLASLAMATGAGAASPAPASAAEGQALFEAKCTGCHSIGQGRGVGPDLQGVTQLRDEAWLTEWMMAPDQMIAAGDPIATQLLAEYGVPMPNMGLSQSEVASLIAYLATTAPGSSPSPAASPSPTAVAAGDVVQGRGLYTGAVAFTNGGPPCRACHTISGIGVLGGGSLGPDHTTSYQRLGDAIISFTKTGTMLPVYGTKPLTAQEEADLLAFFRTAPLAERPTDAIWLLAGLATLGAVLLAGLAAIIWRHRLEPVRIRMLRGTLPTSNRTTRRED